MAVWDGASAIRFLRANAGKYRIDPERIAAVGLSAGGWLLQELAPADSASVWKQDIRGATTGPQCFPVIEPHPANAEFSAQVCALVSDWGAARLCKIQAGLGPNDPPVFTCAASETKVSKGIKAYRDAGAIVELGLLVADKEGQALDGNTFKFNPDDFGHGLVGVAKFGKQFRAKSKTGADMDFGDRTLQFLDEYVKNPATAVAPEMFPQGGPVHGATAVTLRSVHANAKLHYTVDGSEPTERSPVYAKPVTVTGAVTMKALTVKPGLKPSPVTTAVFTSASCSPPAITTIEPVYRVKVNQPFAVTLQAKSERPVTWYLSGKIKAKAVEEVNPNKDNSGIKRQSPWLTLDPQTGLLSGAPKEPGVNVFIVSANVKDGKMVLCDARSVIVVAE
jgi:hypothetical protein